jgi:transketolase
MLNENKISELEGSARKLRVDVIEMLERAGSGHTGGSLGAAEIMAALYFSGEVKNFPDDPNNEERDRVLLSCGHICPVWYAALAEAGYFPKEKLKNLRKIGMGMQGHPLYRELPGVENTSGSLGQGLAQAIGQALAARMNGKQWRVYCVMSDGELEEGSTWEAFMLAGKEKLGNLTAIISRNGTQIDGRTEDVMPVEPLIEKLKAFNWRVWETDGNKVKEVVRVLTEAKNFTDGPSVIVAKTVIGKGVPFMEGKYEWHAIVPSKEQAEEALKILGVN